MKFLIVEINNNMRYVRKASDSNAEQEAFARSKAHPDCNVKVYVVKVEGVVTCLSLKKKLARPQFIIPYVKKRRTPLLKKLPEHVVELPF